MDEVLIKSSILSCKDMGPGATTGHRESALYSADGAPLPPPPSLAHPIQPPYLPPPRDRERAIVLLLLLLRQVVIGAP